MMDEIYQQAIAKFGKDAQLKMAIEEMAELTQAICKSFRESNNHENIVEEIADVEIMLAQLKIISEIDESKVETWKGLKLFKLYNVLNDADE